MTSLQLFRPYKPERHIQTEWGTGKHEKHFDLAVPRNATWRFLGEPSTQHYQLTKLKLSNVRDNDELVPKPQAADTGHESINLPFPAEHPYASHVPRYAVFPKFDSSDDPKRGVAARRHLPITSEMPGNPFDVTVKQPVMGFPYRHEFQDCLPESQRKPLYWAGEDFFDQQNKVKGNRQQFYPTPPTQICPNLQDRSGCSSGGGGGGGCQKGEEGDGGGGKGWGEGKPRDQLDLSVSARTANALRNVERDQWHTTYQRQFTGLGPANAYELDNFEEKQEKLLRTGREDDSLHPRSVNTFDPTWPVDGRLARSVCPLPVHQQTLVSGTHYGSQYVRYRDPSPKERAERRLLYGAEYLNLPDTYADPGRDVTWRELDDAARPEYCLQQVEKCHNDLCKPTQAEEPCLQDTPQFRSAPQENPYPTIGLPRYPEEEVLPEIKQHQDDQIEQLEAQNRWRVLEAQTPYRDLQALRNRMSKMPIKDQPATFYRHESRYNEERAGLYNTSYDPHVLTGAMDAQAESGSELTNTLDSNIQSQWNVSMPAARLNEDVNAALKWSRTFNLSKPELSGDRREGPEVVQTFQQMKGAQRQYLLPPGPDQACPRVQERELLEREATTMGRGYNVKKFLQQNNLHPGARVDPYTLMSHGNQDLNRVRTQTFLRPAKRSVQFDPSVSVRTFAHDPTDTPNTYIQTQLMDLVEPQPPAPLLSSEERNAPRLIPRYPHPTLPETSLAAEDQDAGSNQTCHNSSLPRLPAIINPLQHSAPPAINTTNTTQTRHVRFAVDTNNNNNNSNGGDAESSEDEDDNNSNNEGKSGSAVDENSNSNNNNEGSVHSTEASATKERYRSFPKRLPGAAHGHGLIDTEYTAQYTGHLHSFLPPISGNAPSSSREEGKIPHFDLGYKKDARFNWQPGQGVPRPQTILLKLQEDFSRSEAQRKFCQTFPEINPELRWNICKGRRHHFWGFNSQILHG